MDQFGRPSTGKQTKWYAGAHSFQAVASFVKSSTVEVADETLLRAIPAPRPLQGWRGYVPLHYGPKQGR